MSSRSVVLISSSDHKNNSFGTGFVIRKSSSAVFLLTCAHVIQDVGGSGQILADKYPATTIAIGDSMSLDLAVLKVEGLWDYSPLDLKRMAKSKDKVDVKGYRRLFGEVSVSQSIETILGSLVEIQSQSSAERVKAWELEVVGEQELQSGCSGSPVLDRDSGSVVGVVSISEFSGKRGLAIAIENLDQIWRMIDSESLYSTMLKLGFRQQVRFFRNLIEDNLIAALLIHGSPEYGQRWLLNRLVNQYLSDNSNNKEIKVELRRRVRSSDASALWRELASRVGLKYNSSREAIRKRVYRLWETQNVLIALHDVDCLPESALQELIQEFWLPIAEKARDVNNKSSPYRLLMFLVDYQGTVESSSAEFVDKLDLKWEPNIPLQVPKNKEFLEEEVTSWIDTEYDHLPRELRGEKEIAQVILENSDCGIPELVLRDICDRCGCDWYEELEKWLKL